MSRQVATNTDVHVTFEDYLECICAVHLASYVESPFKEHGGLMIVGPPAVMKSTLLDVLDRNYPDVVQLSDVNVQTLVDLRDQIGNENIRSLVMPEYGKLYERHPATATNLEGHIRALVAEGFSAASFEDSRMNRLRARCTVLAAMTPTLQNDHFKRWENTGFSRRFLWSLIRLRDPMMLTQAVEEWRLIDFGFKRAPAIPAEGTIPNLVNSRQRKQLAHLLKRQPGGGAHATQLSLLARMLAVLVWHYKRTGTKRRAMDTVQAFASTLGDGGAALVLRNGHRSQVK